MWLNLIVAHTLEALPLVSMFSMRKVSSDPPAYENESGLRLLVCGQGQQCAADALHALADKNDESNCAWLNVGIAGHQSMEIGSCIVANKIVQRSSGARFYPIPFRHELAAGELHTVDQTELSYPDDVAYDMEAAGFFEAASQISTLELVQCVKIVSDNAKSGVENINKQFVRELFEANQSAISGFVKSLAVIHQIHRQSLFVPQLTREVFEKFHLTATQKAQVHRLCQRAEAFGLIAELEAVLDGNAFESMDARTLVAQLSNFLEQQEKVF